MMTLIVPTLDSEKGWKTAWKAMETAGCNPVVMVSFDEFGDGFTKTVNRALEWCKDDVCIMSDDAVPQTINWLSKLRKVLDRGYGFVAPTMPCRTFPISKARRPAPKETAPPAA